MLHSGEYVLQEEFDWSEMDSESLVLGTLLCIRSFKYPSLIGISRNLRSTRPASAPLTEKYQVLFDLRRLKKVSL